MAEIREKVYVKADRNTEVTKRDVTIGDVVKIECTNPTVLARIKSMKLLTFQDSSAKSRDRVAVSILKVITLIHEVYPQVEVVNLGEADFIITFEQQSGSGGFVHVLKATAVVLISFTGAAFSIMSFNNDEEIAEIDAKKFLDKVTEAGLVE